MKLIAEIRINDLPKTVNDIGRAHWTVKHKEAKKWQRLVWWECRRLRVERLLMRKALIYCTRASSREPDFDNLASSFKHAIDGLVRAGVIIDDKPSVIGSPVFEWKYAKQGEGYVVIKVVNPVQEDPLQDGKNDSSDQPEAHSGAQHDISEATRQLPLGLSLHTHV